MKTSLARTFEALSATNEAILYAKSPAELYEKVCGAAFSSGDFLATAVFLVESGGNAIRFAAGFGEDIVRLRGIEITTVAGTPEGSGVCGQAFRDRPADSAGCPCDECDWSVRHRDAYSNSRSTARMSSARAYWSGRK